MLVSPRKTDQAPLFKEVRVSKVLASRAVIISSHDCGSKLQSVFT